jgi:hypothetical protein
MILEWTMENSRATAAGKIQIKKAKHFQTRIIE